MNMINIPGHSVYFMIHKSENNTNVCVYYVFVFLGSAVICQTSDKSKTLKKEFVHF